MIQGKPVEDRYVPIHEVLKGKWVAAKLYDAYHEKEWSIGFWTQPDQKGR